MALYNSKFQAVDKALLISFLTLRADADNSSSLAFSRKESKPPFLSTVLSAEADILNLKVLPKASEARLTLLRLGRNLLRLLFFA